VPLNLVIFAVVWHLARASSEAQRTSLLYTARSIGRAADAELGKYMALAQALSRSPALLQQDIGAFEMEARRAFSSIEDAAVVVADTEGHELMNTASLPGQPLPMRHPDAIAAQKQGFATGSIGLTGVLFGPVINDWIVNIEVPIFKNGQPYRALAVLMKARAYLRLLNDQQIPGNWLVGIMDKQGRIIARVPANQRYAGRFGSKGWRKIMARDGVFEVSSLEGDPVVLANTHTAGEWSVGVAVKKSQIQSAAWDTVRWAALLGGGISAVSLLFALVISSRITGPIAELQQRVPLLLSDPEALTPTGPPELDNLFEALKQSALQRNRSEQALRESEERFRTLADNISQFAWIADASGSVHWYNKRWYDYTGTTLEEMADWGWKKVHHPDHVDRVVATAAEAFRTGSDWEDTFPLRARDGHYRWFLARAVPIRNEAGEVVRWFGTNTDITNLRDVQECLKKAEEEQRQKLEEVETLLAAIPAAVFVAQDPACLYISANPFGQRLLRLPGNANASKSAADSDASRSFDVFSDDSPLPPGEMPVQRAAARNSPVTAMEIELRFKNGDSRFLLGNALPLRDRDGKARGAVGAFLDITRRKRAEAALRHSEERFRGIFEHAATGIAITSLEGKFQLCNPAFSEMLGYSASELRKLHFPKLVHPSDVEANVEQGRRLLAREIQSFEIVNRFVAKNGASVWVHKHVSLLKDASGEPINVVALVTDVTERKRYEEHIELLLHEVNHRSKNLLALVQAVAKQTAASQPNDFVTRFGERIRAMAAAQDLLVQNEWRGVNLDDLVRSQLAHFQDLIGTRIEIDGPPLLLSPSAAQTLGMALHELATNAGKYGSLSNADGRVAIQWSLEPVEAGFENFVIGWTESGGPAVSEPPRFGFGKTVICSVTGSSLDAVVDFELPPEGLKWRLACEAKEVLEAGRPAFAASSPKPGSSEANTSVSGEKSMNAGNSIDNA
jgi:PAS domain S-box-containing protein